MEMFKINNSNQVNIFDSTLYLSDYHKRLLEEGWAGYYRNNIFGKIKEERFKVLYSEKASRPNTPVNIMVSLMILKELAGLTDDELMEALIFDTRFQYALYTTGIERQPISRNAMTNFRNSLIKYELETGIDLYKEEIISLSEEIDACCKMDKTLKRMDSMMISSSCKPLSRIDLIYKVNSNLIWAIKEIDIQVLGEREKKYLEKDFKKENIYDVTIENQKEKIAILLEDSKMLYEKYKTYKKVNELEEYKLLDRLLHEQVDDTTGSPKDSKDIKPTSLQNPSDPDATYRFKYGNNIGYVANITEDIHENGEVYITDYELKQNVYSDQEFMKDYIEKKEDDSEETTLVDAGYYSDELNKSAKEKNITLIPTQTMGKKQTNKELVNFKVDEKTHEILVCPNNEKPIKTKYDEKTHMYSAQFDKEKCNNCPLKEQCKNHIKKKITSVRFTIETYHKAQLEAKMNTEEYKKISNHRAGIEGTMSVLRRKYQIDQCPSKGLLRLKLKLGGDILSINIKKAIKYGKKDANNSIKLTVYKIVEKIFSFSRIFKQFLIPSEIYI